MEIAINNPVECNESLPIPGKDEENYLFKLAYARATFTDSNWQVSENICKIRTEHKDKILEKIEANDDENVSLGAMIALGAEIFDSEVTRYIKIKGKTELANNHDVDVQRNSQACFQIDPPKFNVTAKLTAKMIEFIDKVDLDIQATPSQKPADNSQKPLDTPQKIAEKAIKNCIILSFLSKLFDAVSDKNKFAEKFPKMKEICKKFKDTVVPNYTNSKYSYFIRQQLKRVCEKNGIKDKFIPLTHCGECKDSMFNGSPDTSSFFVHTKMIDVNNAIEISFTDMKTQLKYIGFISENWDCTFLSLLDRNIYMDKKFVPYTGSLSNITLWMDNNYLCFGNVKIDSGETKKRWAFVITVCDDSLVEYKFVQPRSTSLKANAPPTKQHRFDLNMIFPKVCLGMQVKIENHSDVNISRLEANYGYTITGCNFENRSTETYIVPANQITTQYTPFDTVMICAEIENRIGDPTQLLNDLLQTCKNYSISLIKTMLPYYLPEINSEMALNMITKLSDTSSKQELDQIKALMKGKENDIKAKLENTVMEGEKDPKFTAGRDINQLYNSTYGASQIGIFQAWNHGIFYEKTFVQGLKLFFKYKKVCLGFIPMILKTFNKNLPNDLESAKMILNFFNNPTYEGYFSNMSEKDYTEYFNNLVTFVFERDPNTIVAKQAHSSLINKCAQSLIGDLFTLGKNVSNKAKRMPPLLLFSDKGATFSKCVVKNNNYYPVEILLPNGTTKIITSNSYSSCEANKGYRYHFGTDGKQVLSDWKNYIEKDFSGVYKPLLVDYMLKNKICDAKIGDYPSIVLFFANIGLSTLTEVSDDYFDYSTPELNPIDNYFNDDANIKVGWLNNFRDWAAEGTIGYLKIDITRTHSHGVDYDSPNLIRIIDYLARDEAHFPSKIIAFRAKENKLMYFAEYEGTTGQDVGGMFRDSFFLMVNELMDVNIRYFIKPPSTLHCEKNRLVPASNLPIKVASTIGSLIASAIATRNAHKAWNLPRFIWDSFVTNSDLSLLVDCDDESYFNSLKNIVNAMRKGFWKVIPLDKVKNFSGRFIEGLTCGVKKELDFNSFIAYFNPPSRNCVVWPVFTQAISKFTSQEFSKLMGFITGNETPKNAKDFCLKLADKSTSYQDENSFALPFAHTCFNLIEIMPYKTPELLRQKLIICFSFQAEFND
ncbi:hypothetical protein TVAG_190180 [Trichomonas vaginalis G3]|uniref:HECT-type E3 ubiquitin transferase n=1 Tax=Trichomonas vaginalis (strain ATCC PRA-98 / G3) TaxID=412133 RepID=A2DKE7_TRIV3|nr:hypothetical protein TVAG_190180 [Trichomonas vaginalis G3]|eukprot:XP_001580110.1 hypothetical protein [Trichomonas vaginalis G3]